MNVLLTSPNFPLNFYNFARALKEKGVTVLAIGDAPYESLNDELRNNVDDYRYVPSLENYEDVYRTVADLIARHGRIDFVESNNEYWLMLDAHIREDFNITSGNKLDQIKYIRFKSMMKECYKKAGVKTARYHLVDTLKNAEEFVKKVGYPIIVKPDDGMGASFTHKITNEEELKAFFKTKYDHPMIMEEFIDGDLVSYDGICDSKGDVLYETSHCFPSQVMNIVNEELDCIYWSRKEIPDDLRKAGRAVVRAFPARSRFFHLEFFIARQDIKGLAKKGEIIGLEVNMRPPGGYTLDMMNYAADIDVYRIWADMVTKDKTEVDSLNKRYHTVYGARRNNHKYPKTLDEVRKKYKGKIVMDQEVPSGIADAMGDYMIVVRVENKKEILPFLEMMTGGKIDAGNLL